MSSLYPNLEIAYEIVLSMPVAVASCERGFSKLKLNNTYLESTMYQAWLSGLAILTIENKIAKTFNFYVIPTDFTSINVEKCYLFHMYFFLL